MVSILIIDALDHMSPELLHNADPLRQAQHLYIKEMNLPLAADHFKELLITLSLKMPIIVLCMLGIPKHS